MFEALPELGVLAAFAIMCFLVALYYAYEYSFGAMLTSIGNWFAGLKVKLPIIGTISFAFLALPVLALDSSIRAALGAGIDASKRTGLYLWHYSAYAIETLGAAFEDLARSTYTGIDRALHVHVPKYINTRLIYLDAQLAKAQIQILAFPHTVANAISHATKTLNASIARAQAAAIDATLPRIRTAERDLSKLRKQTDSLAKKLTKAGALALVTVALVEMGLGKLRCDRVRKSLGRICSMHPSRLESLLEDTLLIASTISIVELAKELQGIEAEVVKGLRAGVREI